MYTLQNGLQIPNIGFGTADLMDNHSAETAADLICDAIEAGYRLIDTAAIYNTEESVGKAVRESINRGGVCRKDILVSTKLANAVRGYDETLKAFDDSLNALQLDYVDIYLIHWPIPRFHENDYNELNVESWKAMETLYNAGKIKAIGVCNFLPRHLESLIANVTIPPMINQLEIHPWYQQRDTVEYCQKHGIVVEAWGPFRHGRLFGTDGELLQRMATKYNVTVAQLVLAWDQSRGIIPLPKSSSKARLESNIQIPKFEFQADDLALISNMDDPNGHEDFWNYKRLLKY